MPSQMTPSFMFTPDLLAQRRDVHSPLVDAGGSQRSDAVTALAKQFSANDVFDDASHDPVVTIGEFILPVWNNGIAVDAVCIGTPNTSAIKKVEIITRQNIRGAFWANDMSIALLSCRHPVEPIRTRWF
ncbi:MAG: hypothetical protein ACR2Q4_13675 [Geminicoccaceae bacterium]